MLLGSETRCILFLTMFVCGYTVTLKIGAVFDTANKYKERALNYAVTQLNTKFQHPNTKIEAVVEHLGTDDPLEAMAATCSLMKQGVAGILGPSYEHNSLTVQSICDDKDVPYLDVRWVDDLGTPTINFYPSQSVLTQLFGDVITAWEFKDFVILYDDATSLKRITRFLKMHDQRNYTFVVRQLDEYGEGNYRGVLKEVKKKKIREIVLDCSIGILRDVLIQAQQVGLMTDQHKFFITNFDLHTLDLVPFQFSETNITGIRIFEPSSHSIQNLADYIFSEEIANDSLFSSDAPYKLESEVVLIVDAVIIFGKILKEIPDKPQSIDCDANKRWLSGLTISNLIKAVIEQTFLEL